MAISLPPPVCSGAGGFSTVTVHCAVAVASFSQVAVTTHVPAARAVTTPSGETWATASSLLDQASVPP